MSDLPLIAVKESHLDEVVSMNEAAVPAVNSVDAAFFRRMMPQSDSFLSAKTEHGLGGFLLLLPAGLGYDSLNYRWFSDRYADFLYVDRIVVAALARRRGIGRALYDAARQRAAARGSLLTCEVNVVPPNPESMAFHRAFGFREVGQQHTEGGSKTVSLMVRKCDD